MDKNKSSLLIAAVLVIVIGVIGTVAYLGNEVLERQDYRYTFTVIQDGTPQPNPELGGLDFGVTTTNSPGNRPLVIENTYGELIQVQIAIYGTGSGQLSSTLRNFELEAGRSKTLAIMLEPHQTGSFSGTVTATLRRARQ
jgi:hypothetical protein